VFRAPRSAFERGGRVQVIRNIGYVKSQQRRGRLLTAVGLVALVGAFIAVLQRQIPALILLAYGAMFIGFIFFNSGLQIVGKFASNQRKPRSDQLLDKALQRLNDRFTIIHYAQIGKRVVEHLVVHNAGVAVITVRELPGKISVDDRKWKRQGGTLGRLFNTSGPQLGNPTVDNEADIEAVKAALASEGLPDVEVEGAIVFTHPEAEVTGSSPIDVTDPQGLASLLRSYANTSATPLAAKDRLALVEALSAGAELEQATPRTDRRRPAA
jgi:hypothetical protein